jgi:hypothetical protein
MIRQDLTPTVMGDFELDEYVGDNGSRSFDLVSQSYTLQFDVSTEYPLSADAMKAIAGLMNAGSKIMYGFDKEMAANDGKYPVRMSSSLAADIDTLLRTAMFYLVEAKK